MSNDLYQAVLLMIVLALFGYAHHLEYGEQQPDVDQITDRGVQNGKPATKRQKY